MDPSVTSPSFSSSASSSSWFAGIVRGRSIKSGSGGGAPSIPVSTDGVGPGSRKNQLRGALFKYGPKPIQVQQCLRSRFICFCPLSHSCLLWIRG
ncbi:hypothetical protein MUK42_32815 [Musa troglodytarum]|uniref:Uncharacterized protein n=1 Tax=Musa troglodytarum TaxID=320322 RepID=A0A9E7GV24_9LILI|nr:hypothetical protein MUK42_32815 [Musa troglodytarum]